MAASSDIEYCYEGSDEASENEYLDQSLSLWKGFSELQTEEFVPIPLDLHTAASIGQYDCVRNIIQKFVLLPFDLIYKRRLLQCHQFDYFKKNLMLFPICRFKVLINGTRFATFLVGILRALCDVTL